MAEGLGRCFQSFAFIDAVFDRSHQMAHRSCVPGAFELDLRRGRRQPATVLIGRVIGFNPADSAYAGITLLRHVVQAVTDVA